MTAMHFGRSWFGHPLEDACPCPKAPCGLVVAEVGDTSLPCEQHNPTYSKTMRQLHSADACPGASNA